MRIFMVLVVAVGLFAAFALRAEVAPEHQPREYLTLNTEDLISLDETGAFDGGNDPAGLAVELLFVPSQYLHLGSRTLLRDAVTGLACAPDGAALQHIGAPGDDFLVVRGVMGPADPAHGREIAACEVVGYDGVVWEETRTAEQAKQQALFVAGRL